MSRMNRSLFRHHEFQMNLSMMDVAHGDDLPVAHLNFSVGSIGEFRVMGDEEDATSVLPIQADQ